MTVAANGLTKLAEECGELIQIVSKKSAYLDTDTHPDGKGSMRTRMEDKIADVAAASEFVVQNFELNRQRILSRTQEKLSTFRRWHGAQPEQSRDNLAAQLSS